MRFVVPSVLAATLASAPAIDAAAKPIDMPPGEKLTPSALSGLQLPFIANAGQYSADIGFLAPTFAGTVAVNHQGEIQYRLPSQDDKPGLKLTERFVDGAAMPEGSGPAGGVNY